LVEEGDRPLLTRSLRVPDRVAGHLLGSDMPDPAVASLSYASAAAAPEQAAALLRWMGDTGSKLAYVRERPGASGAGLASSAFERVGSPTLALDLDRLRTEEDPQLVATLTAREAGLIGAGVVAGPIAVLIARGLPAV